MSKHLDDFITLVRSSHDKSGKTCHWTKHEEITSLTAVSDLKGPCGCPDKQPCAHDSFKCMNTAAVLAIKPAIEKNYTTQLGELEDEMKPLEQAIAKGQEIIENYVKNRDPIQSAEDATKDALAGTLVAHPLRDVMNSYWDNDLRSHVKKILDMKVRKKLSNKAVSGNPCECLDNKVARLNAEKAEYSRLSDAASEASKDLKPLVTKATPTFSNTLLPVLQGSIKVVAGFMSGNSSKAGHGVSDLLKYIGKDTDSGGRIFTLLKAVEAVADQKIAAMVCAIYHDKQAEALTCQPAGG